MNEVNLRQHFRASCLFLLMIVVACTPVAIPKTTAITAVPSAITLLSPTKTSVGTKNVIISTLTLTPIPTDVFGGIGGKGAFGNWIVRSVGFGSFAAMRQDEAQSWLGKIAKISDGEISFDRFVCEGPVYHLETVNTFEYFYQSKTDPKQLNITQSEMQVLQTGCSVTPFVGIALLENKQIVFHWDGVYFFLEREDG